MHDPDLKAKLQQLFDGKNPKSYGRIISTKPAINERVIELQQTLGTQSLSETLWCILNDAAPPMCDQGVTRKFNTFVLGYRDFCGPANKCACARQAQSLKISEFWKDNPEVKESMKEKKAATMVDRYGAANSMAVDSIREKIENTNIDRYGAKSPVESKAIQTKIKQSLQTSHGVDYPFQSVVIREQAAESFQKNNPNVTDAMQLAREAYVDQHGCNPFANEEVKAKIRADNQVKYTVVRPMMSKEHSLIAYEKQINRKCKLDSELKHLGLVENVDYIRGDRSVLGGKELDFYFPAKQFAVEVGSVFYHSELSAGRGEKYHSTKWSQCDAAGITLLQYFDYEMEDSWYVIMSKIQYMLGIPRPAIGARKIARIEPVDVNTEKHFLSANHIQGFGNDRMLAVGAYIEQRVVAVMCLDIKDTAIEISRYATTLDTTYPGLFSRMLKKSLSYLPDNEMDITSYSDNRHGNGNVYRASGFEFARHTPPEYYYTRDYHSIERKRRYTRAKIQSKFGVDITDKSEWQLMQEQGYDRIWDAGKRLWILRRK